MNGSTSIQTRVKAKTKHFASNKSTKIIMHQKICEKNSSDVCREADVALKL